MKVLLYANIGRWFMSLVLSAIAGMGWWLVADRWDQALGSWAVTFALWGTVPVIAALCAAPRMNPAVYLVNGAPGVVILAFVMAFTFSDVDEPIFSPYFVAVLDGAALLIALWLGAVPLVLWRKLAARSRSRG